MTKISLLCVVIGRAGSAFGVEIDDGEKVWNLKEEIAKKKPLTITCEPDQLQLFLAKKDNAWLPDESEAALGLVEGKVHEDIRLMINGKQILASKRLNWLFEKNNMEEVSSQQIHILVVVPEILTTVEVKESKDGYLTDELAYYQTLGQEIQKNCQQHCGPILNKIDEIYEKGPHPKPFISVEGSSGMGKTQLAFALGGKRRTRPWFYWPLAGSEVGKQRVYKNFLSIATAFDSLVKEDEKDNGKEDILACDSSVYKEKKLWTYGFIIELLRYCSRATVGAQMIQVEEETFKVAKSNLKDVDDVRTRMEKNGEVLPFFILDEMTPTGKNPEMKRKAAFQRNVFRVCGLVVIVMGTDAKITNLVSQSSHSREDAHWWMTVVPCFPPYQSISLGGPARDNAWKRAIKLDGVVKDITANSRGLFSRYFVDAVVQFVLKTVTGNETLELADLLDAAFEAVSAKAQVAKAFMKTTNGADAQFMALSYTHATVVIPDHTILGGDGTGERPPKRRKVGVESMQVHFANLVDEAITDVDVSWGSLFYRGTQNDWSPACHFPVIEKDVLLYLAVLGGKQSAYCNYYMVSRMEYSTVYVFEGFRRRKDTRPHVNTNALSSDGNELENLVAHALFCASRRNGVRGIAFDGFFSALLGEFQAKFFQPAQFDVFALLRQYGGLWRKFADADSSTKIPFLAPPNAKWPDYILQAGGECKFGHLFRAQNAERLDCYVTAPGPDVQCLDQTATNADPLFVCECKNWRKKLDSGAMKRIIAGLNAEHTGPERKDGQRKPKWNNWDLALVFCQEVTQFQPDIIANWEYPGTGIVTVDCKTQVVNWIIGQEGGEKLVIALLTGEVLSDEVSGVVE